MLSERNKTKKKQKTKEGRSGQRWERRLTDEDNGYFHYLDGGDSFTDANVRQKF